MSNTHTYDLICIGSGPAGQRAAVQAAKLGKRVALVEKGGTLGGVCLGTGTIPSKTFREAVQTLWARRGRRPRRRERPTAAALLEHVSDVVECQASVIEDQLCRNSVELLWGEASFKDPHTIVVRGATETRELSADHLLIAVGTKPASPRGAAADGRTIITSDGFLDLQEIPRRMTVVGAGIIGIEFACMFSSLGVEVTLVDGRKRPLEFLDQEIVDELIHQMRSRDVIFRLGEAVDRIELREGPPRRAVLILESGKRIPSELVLFSVGRIGATDGLNLEAAGLEADNRGRLEVNEFFCTRVQHIYACGDVIGYPSLAATSSEQGRLAACHAFGVEVHAMPELYPIGIYSIPEISMVGAPEHELTAQKIPYEVGTARYREIARGQILGDESGFFKMLFHRDDRRLLGVHIIGTGATELLHIGQAVMAMGGGLDYFVQAVFNYPTLAECYKVAALDALNRLTSDLREAA